MILISSVAFFSLFFFLLSSGVITYRPAWPSLTVLPTWSSTLRPPTTYLPPTHMFIESEFNPSHRTSHIIHHTLPVIPFHLTFAPITFHPSFSPPSPSLPPLPRPASLWVECVVVYWHSAFLSFPSTSQGCRDLISISFASTRAFFD